MEQTLSIIKPNAINDGHIGNIIARFEEEGMNIIAAKLVSLTKEKAEGFYIEHKGRSFFGDLIQFMTSAPVMIIVLQADRAIERNREIMGATNPEEAKEGSLRRLYGKSVGENAVHGSDSLESAKREIKYFFEADEILAN